MSSKNKYGASGIVFDKNRNVYRVRIGVNGKRMFVGDFKTLEEAIARRREAEKIYWG
ncbi:hypothetical protein [Caloramator sp. Dgby_cultured_2]|uniref:hypothetical protein n=1 Tax=Caloramator sp. Dgby_cultured_2 TaxID=3029174 RepID=UPI00237D9E30|nr:hypothetical protein [Caloramator sp. Dgby_cultured_2]WDU82286.1 hypothetical protein PWK10_11330 [Caloramator sp. Dgby_cultured_2]